jgi:hypothetical protein
LQELKDTISTLQKEKEDYFREFSQKENELKKQLEIERNEKNSIGKELNELRLLNDKTESVLTETRYQINQKENELMLLREKVKNLIKEKENNMKFIENKPQILRKNDLYRISEEGDKQKDSLQEEYHKGKISKYNKNYENQTQRTVNTLGSEEESINIKDQRNVKKKLFENNNNLNEEKFDKEYQFYAMKSKQKNTKYDMESIVASIIQLEKELVKYIERYKFLSSRLTVIFVFSYKNFKFFFHFVFYFCDSWKGIRK